MKYLIGLLLVAMLSLASGTMVFAGSCTYKPYVRDGKVLGTMVVNEFSTYCGYAIENRAGIRLYVDNEGKFENFSNAYAMDDVLDYLCSKCAYEVPSPADTASN